MHIKWRRGYAPRRHASPHAHVMVVRVQVFEYELSQKHTLDHAELVALRAGILDGLGEPLRNFEQASGLEPRDWQWLTTQLFLQQGVVARVPNHRLSVPLF